MRMRAFNRTSRNPNVSIGTSFLPKVPVISITIQSFVDCWHEHFDVSNTRKEDCTSAEPFFVRVFGVVLKRVFRGKKISGLLFKISGSDFEIRATNFFFAPMWNKRTENQFSIFPPGNSLFCGQVSTGLDAIKAVYLQRRRNYFMAFSPRPYSFRNERSLYAATYALSI